MVSRAEQEEILAGRGFKTPDGQDYLELDLTHLGAERINTRLPLIREVAIKFMGVDPIEKPIPIRPVAHYSMGGIETDIDGHTRIGNIWAAGEAACVSLHGANRLGSNSTAECLVWGAITGREIARELPAMDAAAPLPAAQSDDAQEHVREALARDGGENIYALRRELRATMDRRVGVFRNGRDLAQALAESARSGSARGGAGQSTRSRVYNSNLVHALELDNLIDLAEVTDRRCAGARGVARRPRPARFPDAQRRAVAQAHAGLPHGRAVLRIQAGDHRHVAAGRARSTDGSVPIGSASVAGSAAATPASSAGSTSSTASAAWACSPTS